ncbi:MAG: GNAT family N-acetyltransferase [Eubacterium sp.]|nr:GNAT family N-acetyltransferase [Eubacterium sp.]
MAQLTHVFYEEKYFEKETIEKLSAELKKMQITLLSASQTADVKPENMLLMTGTQALIDFAGEQGIAVLGIEPETSMEHLTGVRYIFLETKSITPENIIYVYERCHQIPQEIGRTARTRIRELSLDDLDALFSLYEKEGVCDYMEPLYERAKEEEYQKAYIENMYGLYGYGMWLVFDPAGQRLIGRAGLEHREVEGEVVMEMGYVIDPAYQRQGYATEVCRFLMDYAKENLSAKQISAFIQPENTGSVRLIQKLGFTQKKVLTLDKKEMLWFLKRLV